MDTREYYRKQLIGFGIGASVFGSLFMATVYLSHRPDLVYGVLQWVKQLLSM